jgi:hypothetical protein
VIVKLESGQNVAPLVSRAASLGTMCAKGNITSAAADLENNQNVLIDFLSSTDYGHEDGKTSSYEETLMSMNES